MTKTLMIKSEDDKTVELTLSNRIGWVMEYKDQFGVDIIPTLMPLLLSISNALAGLAEAGVDFDDISMNDINKMLGSDSMTEAIYKLAALEFTDFLNIVWALNKAEDDTIPEPKKWIRQFDEFPLDEVLPAVFELVARGVMSSKNWERLQQTKKKLQPKKKKATSKK